MLYFQMESFRDNEIIKSYLYWAALAPEGRIKVFQVKKHNIQVSFYRKNKTS